MRMHNTLVIQSHRSPLPLPWLEHCIASVKTWSDLNGFDYRWLGDELFDGLSAQQRQKTENQKVIATDLGRLKRLQEALAEGYDTVIWCDADFMIFDPQQFALPPSCSYGFGREIWVQTHPNHSKKLKTYTKIHNAFMFFRAGNSFLNFYHDSAQALLDQTSGPMPPQFIGPKLLTAIHNVVQCPVVETAGMLSPLILKDILAGGGKALTLFKEKTRLKTSQPMAAANLCSSLSEAEGLTNEQMLCVIERLPASFQSPKH